MTDHVQVLVDVVPVELTNQLREAYQSGRIKPVNALAELRIAKLLPKGIDELDVGQWLRLSA